MSRDNPQSTKQQQTIHLYGKGFVALASTTNKRTSVSKMSMHHTHKSPALMLQQQEGMNKRITRRKQASTQSTTQSPAQNWTQLTG